MNTKWNEIPTVGYTGSAAVKNEEKTKTLATVDYIGSAANKNSEKTRTLVRVTKTTDGDYMHYSDGTTEFIPFEPYYSDLNVWHTIEKYCFPDTSMTTVVWNICIKNVIFNPPATIVFWADGTKTVVKCCEDETFDPEKGLAMAWLKHEFGDNNSYHKIFKKWIPKEKVETVKCDACGKLFERELKDNATYKYNICPECIDEYWKEGR